jgi:uncharacterized protein (DUF697 family)
MIPQTIEELEIVTRDCKKLVNKAALVSAGGGSLPVPVLDVAVDISILLRVLPEINERFGLSNDQVSQYDDQFKILVYNFIKTAGAKLAGKVISKELILTILKKMGIRIASKQVIKYIPIAGTLISAGISFAAMKIICNYHIKECRDVVKMILKQKSLP